MRNKPFPKLTPEEMDAVLGDVREHQRLNDFERSNPKSSVAEKERFLNQQKPEPDEQERELVNYDFYVPISREQWEQEQKELLAGGIQPRDATYEDYVKALHQSGYNWGLKKT